MSLEVTANIQGNDILEYLAIRNELAQISDLLDT